MRLSGKILEVFVLDKEYTGLQVIDLKNWSGRAFVGHRKNLRNISNHPGLKGPSIYFLLSSDQNEESGNFQVYIGETEDFSNRISGHKSKTWWDKFICFSSGNYSLTKAHVKYLEKEFYEELSSEDVSIDLENSQPPTGARLPNSDMCFLEGFAENMSFILKTMGFDYFEAFDQSKTHTDIEVEGDFRDYRFLDGKSFVLGVPLTDLKSKMRVENGKCILEEGSYLSTISRKSFLGSSYHRKWNTLINSDIVQAVPGRDDVVKVVQDIILESPSSAGSMVTARRCNGPKHWKCLRTGMSFKELQREVFDKAA